MATWRCQCHCENSIQLFFKLITRLVVHITVLSYTDFILKNNYFLRNLWLKILAAQTNCDLETMINTELANVNTWLKYHCDDHIFT